jgi:hypothetical protein
MLYFIVSLVVVAAYLAVLFRYPHVAPRGTRHAKRSVFVAVSIRLFILMALCAVPVFVIVSGLLNSTRWVSYAESAVTIEAIVLFSIGFFSLGQRQMARFFKMDTVYEIPEIIFMMVFPLVIYTIYAFTEFAPVYYLAPGFYSLYLIYSAYSNRGGI